VIFTELASLLTPRKIEARELFPKVICFGGIIDSFVSDYLMTTHQFG
jgi:hypothetical protein